MTKRATRSAVAALVSLSLVAAACGGDDDDSSDDNTDAPAATEAPTDTDAAPSTDAPGSTDAAPSTDAPGSTDAAPSTDAPGDTSAPTTPGDISLGEFDTDEFSGEEVVIMTTFEGAEGEIFNESWRAFEEATGITIVHENTNSLEDDIKLRVDGGDAPDMSILPQPGLLANLARDGSLTPLTNLQADVEENNIEGWVELGTVDGTFYSPPFGANIKSLVWYSPSMFEEAGYEIPTTWDEWIAIADDIVANGGKPFCGGVESGGATGWPLTDWLEEVVLRTAGPDVYDQWVAHEIPFNDPAIVEALDTVGSILKNEDYVFPSVEAQPSVSQGEAGLPILDGECWMYQHPSFFGSNFPEGTELGPDGDVNVFLEPMMNADDPFTMLGGGELIAAFNDRPVVEFVAKYLTSAEYANSRMSLGNWISPNKNGDISLIPDDMVRQYAEFLVESDVFRFDGSDLMPGEIGAALLWSELVEWVVGNQDSEQTLTNVEEAWVALG